MFRCSWVSRLSIARLPQSCSRIDAPASNRSASMARIMTQNIYDQDDFFDRYARLPRSVAGLDAVPEWPALHALLPHPPGRVVDLGCGYGWFARWAAVHQATSVLALDVSEKMLARARAATTHSTIRYLRADLETLELDANSFDLAYSSLALHYITDLDRLLATVRRALAPGGAFVFSVEHPLFTAPTHPNWLSHPAGHTIWPLDAYLDEGPRTRDWLVPGVIKQHRTPGTYLNTLLRHGFALNHIEEWGPPAEAIATHPEWAVDHQRPPLLISARRPT